MREDGGEEPLAPVIPLFGDPAGLERAGRVPVVERAKRVETWSGEASAADHAWSDTWSDDVDDPIGRDDAFADAEAASHEGPRAGDAASRIEAAEKVLLRRLHGRSLSVSEARALLRSSGLDPDECDTIVVAFLERGYLDDSALAEQLVHVGVDRRGSGRRVIAQTLAKRGIPREVADAALTALPDDDAERALEFARTKARSLAKLDHDTALRRLSGQLARRGYGGSVALTAARRALAEEVGDSGGVRFR